MSSWPITFTLWLASHKVNKRQVQKKEKEVTFQDTSGYLAVNMYILLWVFLAFHSVEGDRRSSGKKTLSLLCTTTKLHLALEILEL